MKYNANFNKVRLSQILRESIDDVLNANQDSIYYIALVLDEPSVQKLRRFAKKSVPSDFEPRFVCHHMTIAFNNGKIPNEIMEWTKANEGKKFPLRAVQFGCSDKATGVHIETQVPCSNKIKHITMTTNLANGGKPVDTNFITQWHDIEPMDLQGTVEIIYKK